MTVEVFAQGLTKQEEQAVVELAEAVSAKVKTSAALTAFCTRGTYVRYLRARSWNVHKAARMLEDTLKWRLEYLPDQLRWEDVQGEAARGKVYLLHDADEEGRPVVFMRPRKEEYGGDNDKRVQYVVYIMEQASRLADAHAPDGKMTWLLDHVGYNRKNQPPWKVSLLTLQIVQNHYPERLGRAVNFQPPFLFELFWKAIRPFVDPVTRDKVVFVHQGDGGEISKYVDLQHLDDTFGGPLPEDGMLDLKAYAQRMGEADARHQARLAAAAAELGV